MKKLIVAAALAYGGWWYVSNRMLHEGPLAFARKNPQASWAPAFDYWTGLYYYQRGEYPKSQEAFTQLLTDYSTSTYTSDALLRLSEVAGQNRDYELARQSLQRLLEEFPDHKDKRLAEQRLEMVKYK